MARAENIGPNQNISGVSASKPKAVKGPENAPQNIVSEAIQNVASNVGKYFKAGKELGLSSKAANLLANLTARRFGDTTPKDKGNQLDNLA